jgi:long-subunit fatty acid transport protein
MARTGSGWLVLAGVLGSLTPSMARAAGVEDTVGGSVALGRAANYVRANDFMAVWQNPANLAVLPGIDAGLELRVPIFSACFDRAKDNSQEYDPYEKFGQVCNEAAPMPAGNLGVVGGHRTWGWGVGIYTPSGVGNLKFGDDNIRTQFTLPDEADKQTTTGSESPNRYLLLEREVLSAFAMVGVAYAPIRELRLGLSGGVGFAKVHYSNVASLDPKFTDQQAVNQVNVTDWAIPRATASVVVAPVKSFEIMAMFTYAGDVEAKGHVDIRANGFQGAKRGNCLGKKSDASHDPGTYCRVDDVSLTAPYHPFEAMLGLRYAQRRPGRRAVLDPMRNERWDIELDAYWAQTSNVDAFTLDIFADDADADDEDDVEAYIDFSSDPGADRRAGVPSRARLKHNWRDTFGARLGGDVNLLEGVMSMRLGVSYESRAVPKNYMNIDYWPVQKVGLHAGLTAALGDFRITVAYAHLFNEQIDVKVGEGKVTEVAAKDPHLALPVNEGRYISASDIVSLQGNLKF